MEIAVLVLVGWVVSVCLHEFGHAIVAYWGGDTTVKDKGYLTLNLFKYTDPGVTLIFPIFILMIGGIPLPGAAVYIDHSRLRSRFWESACALAGPVVTALCGVAFATPFLLHAFPPSVPDWVWVGLAYLVQLEMFVFLLNSLPVPPFDGYGFFEPWLPMAVKARVRAIGNYALWIVLLLLMATPLNDVLWHAANSLTSALHVPYRMALIGSREFHENAVILCVGLVALLFIVNRNQKQEAAGTPVSNEAQQHFQNAKQLLSENKPIDAIDALNQAISARPDFVEAWQLRGVCFGLINRHAEALGNFDRAIAIEPQYADAWYNRAVCLALQGRYDEALSDLANAVKLAPDSIKEHAKQDVGFRPLRNDLRFQQLVGISGDSH